jgi:hypothetical protein
MNKAFQEGIGHDEVWIIESDKMKNYKNYFEVDNSCNLEDKFSVEKRFGAGEEFGEHWSKLRSKHHIGGDNQSYERTGATKKSIKTTFKTLKALGVKVHSDQ